MITQRSITLLLRQVGYKVEFKTSPIEALELIKADPDAFDLIITDMSMPKMPGDQFASEVLKIRPDFPIIVCTGFSEKLSLENAKSLGVKAILMKPVITWELAKKVRKVLDDIKK